MGALLLGAMLPSMSLAQTGEDALRFTDRAPATGPRMMGMAGVGIAGVGDYGALLANPAGLGYIGSSVLGGSLNTLSVVDETRYQTAGRTSAGEGDIRGTHLGNLAYLYKVPTSQGSLVVGAAYNQLNTFDRSVQYAGPNSGSSISDSFLPYSGEFEVVEDNEGFPMPQFFHVIPELAYNAGAIEFLSENVGTTQPLFYQAVVPGTTIDQTGDVLEEGRMSELSFGGAWEAAPDVMVGLSGNFSIGTYRFNSFYAEDDTRDENAPEDYIVILEDRELQGFDYLEYEQGFESDLTGFNLRAGVSGEVASGVRVGLVLETPTFYNISEEYFRDLVTGFDQVVGVNQNPVMSSSQEGDFEYSLRTPWRMGGGAAWTQGNLLVAGDLEYVDWSQMEFDSDDGTFDDENRNIRENLDPVWNTRIGAEYRFASVAVRGGLAWQPDPRSFEIQSAGEATDRSKFFLSAGVGFHFADQFIVDLGWMQERFDDEFVPYGDVAEPPVVEEEVVRNRVSVGVRVRF